MSKGKRVQRRGGGKGVLAVLLVLLLAGAAVWGFVKWQTPVSKEPERTDAPSDAPRQTLAAPDSSDEALPLVEPKASPEPTPEPTPEPEPPTLAEQTLAGMTLEEKIYQMFIVFPMAITGIEATTAAGEVTRLGLQKYPVGGFLYDGENMIGQEQVRTMLANTQSYARIPMILICDEEGGQVARLMRSLGTTWFGPMLNFKDQGPAVAKSNAQTIASDMASFGFNMDLAPVADVWSNPQNTVIGNRAYSDSFTQAAELIPAAVEGFHAGGVACTLKHFPGHGGTAEDSHYGSAYVYKSLEDIRKEELLPFQAGIDAGADAVMMGHLIVVDVDDEPALFSEELVTGLLREEMGFEGVIISDGLQMQAMIDYYSSGEIARRAVKAGVDVLLCPLDLEAAANALLLAVETGEITEARIDESVLRILTLKENRGILTEVPGAVE